jgi:hypothetical protein
MCYLKQVVGFATSLYVGVVMEVNERDMFSYFPGLGLRKKKLFTNHNLSLKLFLL